MKDSTPLVTDPSVMNLIKKYPPDPKMPTRYATSLTQQSTLTLHSGDEKKRFLEVFNIDNEEEGDCDKAAVSIAKRGKTREERARQNKQFINNKIELIRNK